MDQNTWENLRRRNWVSVYLARTVTVAMWFCWVSSWWHGYCGEIVQGVIDLFCACMCCVGRARPYMSLVVIPDEPPKN